MYRLILITLLAFLLPIFSANAQEGVSIGKSGQAPNQFAHFEVFSTSKGMLIPRMTTEQRMAILPDDSAYGLLVYDSDEKSFYFWSGIEWVDFRSNLRLDDGKLFIGGSDNAADQVVMSGDATIQSNGYLNISDFAITSSKLADNAVTDSKLDKSGISISGFAAATDTIDLGGNIIKNLGYPVNLTDASSKAYVINEVATGKRALDSGAVFIGDASGFATSTNIVGDVTLSSDGLVSLADTVVGFENIKEAAIKTWHLNDGSVIREKIATRAVDNNRLDKGNIPLSGFAVPIAPVAFGDATHIYQRLVNLASPINDNDATNKMYVDNSNALLQAELDTTQAGAGLEEDGTYEPILDANYIANATNLKHADQILDSVMYRYNGPFNADIYYGSLDNFTPLVTDITSLASTNVSSFEGIYPIVGEDKYPVIAVPMNWITELTVLWDQDEFSPNALKKVKVIINGTDYLAIYIDAKFPIGNIYNIILNN